MRDGGAFDIVLPAGDPRLNTGAAAELLAILMEASPEPLTSALADAA